MKNKRWQIFPELTHEAEQELSEYPPVFRQILFNRGLATKKAASDFLSAAPQFDTSPYQIKDMAKAVDRILFALNHNQQIAIYGDYDVDGVTSTALLVLFLRSVGGNVVKYIPNRFEEGYGLNKDAITSLSEQGTELIITVDCGVRSIEEVAFAKSIGIDIIISDHHHTGSELPDALAVIDPKQPGDMYPDKNLAGVGLAYKIGVAVSERLNSHQHRASDYLDLVALGTVADLAPLTGENRALVRDGIDLLRRTNRQGLFSLMKTSGVNPQKVSASHIGYMLGPRLNAAGRLQSALAALNLLITDNLLEASSLAQELDAQNKKRQEITTEIQKKAEQLALQSGDEPILLFAADEAFNPGVVGLAASRLVEDYYRPAIVAHRGEEYTRGSCRSIPEFHITEALDSCADILEHYGGHAAAAGFTVKNANLEVLQERLLIQASEKLENLELIPNINIDVAIKLSNLTPEILPFLDKMQPTGYGNPQAKFLSRSLHPVSYYAVGKEKKHLKMKVSDGRITYDAIAFNQGDWVQKMPDSIDLVYTFEVNEYQGRRTLQLNVKDLKPGT